MADIKGNPTKYKTYYKLFIGAISKKLEEANKRLDTEIRYHKALYDEVKERLSVYEDRCNINLMKYKEFVEDDYKDGKLFRLAKNLFINRKEHYNISADAYNLYKVAKSQKDIADIKNQIDKYIKLVNLSIEEYRKYLVIITNTIHKKMILEGYGYAFSGKLGWICINRCKLTKPKKKIDYAKTKKRKQELIEQGAEIFDSNKAQWCAQRGIEYNGVDYRVYKTEEFVYEVPLIHSNITNANDLKFVVSDYRGNNIRGKTNEELIAECGGDKNKICELPLDIKSKLTLCNSVDKMLYLNFIRNEGQKSIISSQANSENRQRLQLERERLDS